MGTQLLDSLYIEGYRCFDTLRIETLGQVNLIVGKNNVGKTALLEALWIYASRNPNLSVEEVLSSRKEDASFKVFNRDDGPAYRHIFHNRRSRDKIEIGSLLNTRNRIALNGSDSGLNIADPPIRVHNPNPAFVDKRPTNLTSFFVGIRGLKQFEVEKLWEKIELTPLEDKVLESLRLISPRIRKVRPRVVKKSNLGDDKVVYAQIDDNEEPFPLRSFGEGLNKLFEIALVLVSCKDGILLIDEIENGLHYSVLPDLWRLIFFTAKELNVQVFATTHGQDCVEAFAIASEESPENGVLIRLENQGGKIVAKAIEEEMLVDAVNYEVEVR